jgi:hypothetical protein
LKGVENVDSLGMGGDIDDAKGTRNVPHPDFPNALSDAFHRFPIVGIKASLDAIKLKPSITSWPIWERT